MGQMKVSEVEVREFWESHPCGLDISSEERYKTWFYIPGVVDFPRWKGKSVLEVGCGMGVDGREFVRNGAKYVGLDFSRTSSMNVLASATCLPFADSTFDLVYSQGVLHHVPDTALAVEEIVRVLKKSTMSRKSGGTFIGMFYAGGWNSSLKWIQLVRKWKGDGEYATEGRQGLDNPLSKFYTPKSLSTLLFPLEISHLERHYVPKSILLDRLLGHFFGGYLYVEAHI